MEEKRILCPPMAGSMVLDLGDSSEMGSLDQRENIRGADGIVDIGAVERQSTDL